MEGASLQISKPLLPQRARELMPQRGVGGTGAVRTPPALEASWTFHSPSTPSSAACRTAALMLTASPRPHGRRRGPEGLGVPTEPGSRENRDLGALKSETSSEG